MQNCGGLIIEGVCHRVFGMQPLQPVFFEPKMTKDRSNNSIWVRCSPEVNNRTITENICRSTCTTDCIIALINTYMPS